MNLGSYKDRVNSLVTRKINLDRERNRNKEYIMKDINLMEIASIADASKPDPQPANVVSEHARLDRHSNGKLFLKLTEGIRNMLNGSPKQAVKPKEDDPDQSGPFRMHNVPWIAIR